MLYDRKKKKQKLFDLHALGVQIPHTLGVSEGRKVRVKPEAPPSQTGLKSNRNHRKYKNHSQH